VSKDDLLYRGVLQNRGDEVSFPPRKGSFSNHTYQSFSIEKGVAQRYAGQNFAWHTLYEIIARRLGIGHNTQSTMFYLHGGGAYILTEEFTTHAEDEAVLVPGSVVKQDIARDPNPTANVVLR